MLLVQSTLLVSLLRYLHPLYQWCVLPFEELARCIETHRIPCIFWCAELNVFLEISDMMDGEMNKDFSSLNMQVCEALFDLGREFLVIWDGVSAHTSASGK